MSIRKFVASSRIRVGIGACGTAGAASMVGLLRLEENATERSWFSSVSSGGVATEYYDCIAQQGAKFGLYRAGAYSKAINTEGLNGVWILIGITKAAGTVKPVIHLFRFDTKAFTHTEGELTQTDQPENPGGQIAFGQWGESDQFKGAYAAAAKWNKALTNAEFEALAEVSDLSKWLEKSPNGMWFFNQSSGSEEVKDLTGNGANQTALVGTEYLAEEPPIPFSPPTSLVPMESRRSVNGLILR